MNNIQPLHILPDVFLKLDYITKIQPNMEVCTFLKVEEHITKEFKTLNLVTDIIIPPQTVGGTMADPDEQWQPPDGYTLWHHSHHNMAPNPSGEDNKTIEKRAKEAHTGMTYGLITSHKAGYTLRAGLCFNKNYGIYDNVGFNLYHEGFDFSDFTYKQWPVVLQLLGASLNEDDKKALDDSYKANVKSHVAASTACNKVYPYGGQYKLPGTTYIAPSSSNVKKLSHVLNKKSKGKKDKKDKPRYSHCDSCQKFKLVSQGYLNYMLCEDCNDALMEQEVAYYDY